MAIITFPRALREKIDEGYPHICFTPQTKGLEYEALHLYAPQGVSIVDGASYNGVELGVIRGAQTFASQIKDKKLSTTDNQQLVAGLKLLDKMGADATSTASIGIDKGVAFNSQTALAFENMNLRTFSFAFELVAESDQESLDIKSIERFFRKYMYPEVENFVARYPEKWKIQFFEGEDENPFYPMIYDCFLTGLTTEINAEGNSYHQFDERFSAPTSTKIQLEFAEARMLSRQDLYKNALEYNYDRPASQSGGTTPSGG